MPSHSEGLLSVIDSPELCMKIGSITDLCE